MNAPKVTRATKAFLNEILKRKNDKKTWLIVGSILACILLLFVLVIASKHRDALQNKNSSNNASTNTTSIEPFAKIAEFRQSATGEAIGNLQTDQTQTNTQLKDLESQNKKLLQQLKKSSELKPVSEPIGSIQNVASDSAVQSTNATSSSNQVASLQSPQVVNLSNQAVSSNATSNLNALGAPVTKNHSNQTLGGGISDFSFQYSDDETGSVLTGQKCTPKNCVLPGTFARAVLLGAADANASVNGQSNTTPILFRILGRGVLPNGFHSHLRGCFVVGEVYGDISSERGEVKLAQISCVLKGKTITKSINGTAYFMGKEGIRGRAIMRNGPVLWNAGISGMLSGLAQGVQSAQQTQSVSPLGTTTTVPTGRIATSMAAGGIQSAANTLANYYVKLADQYHPIIELNAGTIVNLVFLNKFLLTPNHPPVNALVTQSSSDASNTSNIGNTSGAENMQDTQNTQQTQNGNLSSYSYGQSVNNDQVNNVQSQINQVGQS